MRGLASLLVLITALGVGLPSVYRTVHRRFFGVNHGVYLEDQAMEYYYPNEVRVIVEQMARARQRPPVPAGLDKITGESSPRRGPLLRRGQHSAGSGHRSCPHQTGA